MKRKVFLNDVPNVHMYAFEGSGSNSGNCSMSCGGVCHGGGDSGGDDWVIAAVETAATVASEVVIVTATNPEIAMAATTVGPGPTIA